ncbi:alpha/beta fold hydrolase [uncultured Jatrophihabitans sp.]|uniref:alpha/beta fold hydrolase n=1 Tax=uncultured Jatrophihabitans sp. TaxID=1610747 RepID=UPI0035CA546D
MTYIQVSGRRIWHEVTGDGPPVVLLHGGFSGADAFAAQTPALVADGWRVHVPERRGHAHTPDGDGEFSYAAMADETVSYLEQELAQPVPLVGWSDGAIVAVLVALRRPDLVARMALIGQYYNSDGQVPDSRLAAFLHTEEAKDYLRRDYDPVSPDGPEHFGVIYAKMMRMIDNEPELDLDDFAAITVPVLVLQGDRDEVRLEHSQQVVAALPDARLAVLPGTHGLPAEAPELVNPLLIAFLRGRTGAGS